jgi:RimJ/RimL family protein N-acetyltransferase
MTAAFTPRITRVSLVRGKHVLLREVQESDAAFILRLRLHPIKGRYLSPVDDDEEKQRAWIRNYQESEGQAYFVICDARLERLGTVRIYDAQGSSFSWGSWILTDAAPTFAAIESALLVYHVATQRWGFQACHFKVHRENINTLGFHTKFGARRIAESDLDVAMSADGPAIEAALLRYRKHLPESVEIQ